MISNLNYFGRLLTNWPPVSISANCFPTGICYFIFPTREGEVGQFKTFNLLERAVTNECVMKFVLLLAQLRNLAALHSVFNKT